MSIKIIGSGKIKSRYVPDLADRINKSVEEQNRGKTSDDKLNPDKKVKQDKTVTNQNKSVTTNYTQGDYISKAISKAKELVKSIEEHIGYDKGTGFIKRNVENDDLLTSNNALLAIYKHLSGGEEEARKLVKKIEKRIGYENGLIKDGVENDLLTSDNVLLAIYKHLSGEEEEAKKLVKKIEKRIGYENGLIKGGVGYCSSSTYDNILLAIYKHLSGKKGKAKKLTKNVEEKIGYKSGLIKGGISEGVILKYVVEDDLLTYNNALLVVVEYLSGEGEEAKELIKNIEEKIEHDKNTGLVKAGVRDNRLSTFPNLALAFAYLTLGGALDKYKTK